MASEYIVGDSIVACLTIKAPIPQAPEPRAEPWFRHLSRLLRTVCLPKVNAVKLFDGRAYYPVYANNLDPKYSCSWTETGDGGGFGQLVLAWADQPKMRVRVTVKLAVAKDGRWAWLTVGHNPTSLTVGHNIHPAAFIDPTRGVAHLWPSSSWAAMTRAFRLGFEFLAAMSEPYPLFDAAAKLVIARGDFHLVRVQYAATKAVTNVTDFLQVTTVIYGQTIARGQGIVNNAKHLGLRFKPYAHPDPDDDRLSGLTLQKYHGRKLHLSVAFYDKLIRIRQMHQEGTLSLVEAQTVDQSVREDITAHSSFVLTIVAAAWEKLANMSADDRKFFAFLSPDQFLQGTPQSTAWWLQRAISLLSHRRQQGRWVRYSFGTWLVPFVEQEVLHLDVVAGITTRGYYALLALTDKVAAAWRSDPKPGAGNWAGRLARVAGCTRSTVYNRRDKWRREYGIDIARPLQMYSDILYYGHNSLAKPESITALMVAVDQEDGDEAVRLHADAIADFERTRVQVVNPALVRRPRAMELKLPPLPSPELDGFDDLPPDFDDVDLIAAVPTRPVSARPTIASSAANSHAPQVRQGRAQESRTSIALRTVPTPPPPTEKKGVLRTVPTPPPPTEKKGVLPAMPSPPPPATASNVMLRAAHRPLPSPTGKKVIFRTSLSPPPPGTKAVLRGPLPSPPPPPTEKKVIFRASRRPPPPSTGSNVVLRAMPSPPPPPTWKKVVLRGTMPSPPPPPTWKKVVLRGPLPTPPPPPTRKKLVLRGPLPSPPPPPTEKRVVFRAMRSPPPPATAVRISTGRSSVGSVDVTIRRQESEQCFDYRSSVLRALLASKSWTRTGSRIRRGLQH